MPPQRCSVNNCVNASSNIHKKVDFFNFPKEAKTLAKWILFTGKANDWRPTDSHKLCSEHFRDSAFLQNSEWASKRKLLKINAIPTIVTMEECSDDVEYVMEDSDEESDELSSDKEQVSDEKCAGSLNAAPQKRRSNENREKMDSLKRFNNDDKSSTAPVTKRTKAEETQPGSKKSGENQHFASQFMKFVGVFEPKTKAPKETRSQTTTQASSLAETRTKLNSTREQDKAAPIHGCNEGPIENLADIATTIRTRLNAVEKTILHALDQIDVIGKDLTKLITSKQFLEQGSEQAATHIVKKVPKDIGNGSTNLNQSISKNAHEESNQKHSPVSKSNALSKSNTFDERFPICSSREFQKFNEELVTNIELKEFMVEMFKKTNIPHVEIFVEENLKSLVTESVAKSMSWSGSNTKFAVKATTVIALLRDAIVERFNCQMKSPAVNLIRFYFGK